MRHSRATRAHRVSFWPAALAVGLLAVTLPFAGFAADPEDGPQFVPGELIVQFKNDAPESGRQAAMNRIRGVAREHVLTQAMRRTGHAGVFVAGTRIAVPDAVRMLNDDPSVEFAEPNWIYQHMAVANDPDFPWNLWEHTPDTIFHPSRDTSNDAACQAEKAWNAGNVGSQQVYVGVIDEGVQFTHPDLAGNVWTNPYDPVDGVDNDGNGYIDDIHGWDFAGNNNSVYDGTSDDHGTHVTGTIAAKGGDGLGIVGMNWNVTYIPAKYLGAFGGTTTNAIKALDYFTNLKVTKGLNIVATNNSWGGGGFSQALLDAITRAAKQDILFIAAAGNGGGDWVGDNNDVVASYPSNYNTTAGAGYDAVIAVAAHAPNSVLAGFSNYGQTTVDLSAPGDGIQSTVPNGYAMWSGTSMATPHVTGAAALYAAAHPGASAPEIRAAILNSVTPATWLTTKTVTGGILDVASFYFDPSAPPAAPAALRAAADNARIDLAWARSSGATTYRVFRAQAPDWFYTQLDEGAGTTYADVGLPNGVTYRYYVTAVGANGQSGASNVVEATPHAPADPSAFTAVAVSRTQINLTWKDNADNETGFRLERSSNGGATYPTVYNIAAKAGTGGTVSFSNTGLVRNTTYTYRLRAYSAYGESGTVQAIAKTKS